MAYVRTVKTASGATAVQIVHSSRAGSREIEHIGSAHSPDAVEALKAAARQRLHVNQDTLDLGDGRPAGEALPITQTRAAHLWEALSSVYDRLGLDAVTGRDEVFKALVLARVIEPVSKLDTIRVLAEIGVDPPGYRTIFRRLKRYASAEFSDRLTVAFTKHAGLGPATLLLYDVTTLYFETDRADGFREPGYSKERRLEPQITVGLLTTRTGFPLLVDAFAGNRAETTTIVPVLEAFRDAHGLVDLAGVTVAADAGMLSEANLIALDDARLGFVVGARIPNIPYQVDKWRDAHPGEEPSDQLVLTQPQIAGTKAKPRRWTVFYQYRADRARRTLRGIDEQVGKAEQAVAGKTSLKRNRFITWTGGTRKVNRDLEVKARALAGWKGYVTNLPDPTADMVIGTSNDQNLWMALGEVA